MKAAMSVVWLVLALLFVLLGRYYHAQSFGRIPHIEIQARPLEAADSPVKVEISIAGAGVDEPLQEYVSKLNEQVDATNRAASKANRLTAYGYYLAAFAAFVSMVLEWREPLARLVG